MSETTAEIQAHIHDTRENLDAQLHELGQKVKAAADWRQHFEKSPGMFLAAALGGGLLVGIAAKGRRRRSELPLAVQPVPAAPPSRPRGPLADSIDEVKGALVGLVATRAKSVLSELLPGFAAQLSDGKPSANRTSAESGHGTVSDNGTSTNGRV